MSQTAGCAIASAISRRAAACTARRTSPSGRCGNCCATVAGSSARAARARRSTSVSMPPNPERSSICRRWREDGRPAMMVLPAAAEKPDRPAIHHARRFRIEFVREWKQAAARCSDISPATPFQHPQWLDAWYRTFAGVDDVEPLIAIISDAATGEQVALLPLICRLQKGIRIVEFADLGTTDYNAPMLTAAAPRDARAARALWRDLKAALRRGPRGAASSW